MAYIIRDSKTAKKQNETHQITLFFYFLLFFPSSNAFASQTAELAMKHIQYTSIKFVSVENTKKHWPSSQIFVPIFDGECLAARQYT